MYYLVSMFEDKAWPHFNQNFQLYKLGGRMISICINTGYKENISKYFTKWFHTFKDTVECNYSALLKNAFSKGIKANKATIIQVHFLSSNKGT